MWCNQSFNHKIDRLNELSLQIVYNDKTSDFSELLEKDIHYQNIRQLATKMFKESKGVCPKIAKGLFQFRNDIPYLMKGTNFTILLYEQFLVVQRVLNFLGLKIGNLYQIKWKN